VTDLGTGSFEGVLDAGDGVFLIQRAGEERRIEVTLEGSDEIQELSLNLDPRDDTARVVSELGTLTIRMNLAFAAVSLDGVVVGVGIGEFESEVTPGLHTVRVSQDGYQTVIDNVRVDSGESLSWQAPPILVPIGGANVGGIVTAVLGVGGLVAGVVMLPAADSDDSIAPAIVALGVGGALAITSIVLFATGGPDNSASASVQPPLRFAVGPTSDGWGVTLGFDSSFF
jgi:hypothetical protein